MLRRTTLLAAGRRLQLRCWQAWGICQMLVCIPHVSSQAILCSKWHLIAPLYETVHNCPQPWPVRALLTDNRLRATGEPQPPPAAKGRKPLNQTQAGEWRLVKDAATVPSTDAHDLSLIQSEGWCAPGAVRTPVTAGKGRGGGAGRGSRLAARRGATGRISAACKTK